MVKVAKTDGTIIFIFISQFLCIISILARISINKFYLTFLKFGVNSHLIALFHFLDVTLVDFLENACLVVYVLLLVVTRSYCL